MKFQTGDKVVLLPKLATAEALQRVGLSLDSAASRLRRTHQIWTVSEYTTLPDGFAFYVEENDYFWPEGIFVLAPQPGDKIVLDPALVSTPEGAAAMNRVGAPSTMYQLAMTRQEWTFGHWIGSFALAVKENEWGWPIECFTFASGQEPEVPDGMPIPDDGWLF